MDTREFASDGVDLDAIEATPEQIAQEFNRRKWRGREDWKSVQWEDKLWLLWSGRAGGSRIEINGDDASGLVLGWQAQEQLAALTAERDALQEQVAQGWQGIETAPKDGTEVVLLGSLWNDPNQTLRACLSWYYALGWFFTAPGYANGFNPTHWMPLPQPPADLVKEKG